MKSNTFFELQENLNYANWGVKGYNIDAQSAVAIYVDTLLTRVSSPATK